MALADFESKFGGKWKEFKSENVDNFLQEMGVNVIKRKAASALSPSNTIVVEGDKIKIIIEAGPMTRKGEFELGKPCKNQTESGDEFMSTATYENGVLTVENENSKKKFTAIREINDGVQTMTLTMNGVTAKRMFKKC